MKNQMMRCFLLCGALVALMVVGNTTSFARVSQQTLQDRVRSHIEDY